MCSGRFFARAHIFLHLRAVYAIVSSMEQSKRKQPHTFEAIWQLARQIPFGRVTTYGHLARLAGNPRLSRVVGYAMHGAPPDVPCHRVVNRRGELSAAFAPLGKDTHRALLEAEDVPFLPDGRVDLSAVLWPGT